MSLEAMVWALKRAQVSDPIAKLVLIGLADHAQPDGTAAWPSQKTLAVYAGVSVRTVAYKLDDLEHRFGAIMRGDQQLTKHLPPNRRPVVWDLLTGMQHLHGMQNLHASLTSKDCRPANIDGFGMQPVADKPYLEPSLTNSSREVTSSRPDQKSTPPTDDLRRVDRCPRHQDDQDPGPCGPCGSARRNAPRVLQERANQLQRSKSAEAKARAQDRRRAVDACTECDYQGRIGGRICHHSPQLTDAATRGVAAVRAALNHTGAPR